MAQQKLLEFVTAAEADFWPWLLMPKVLMLHQED